MGTQEKYKYQLSDLAAELEIDKTKLFYYVKKYSAELGDHVYKNENAQTSPILLDTEGYNYLFSKLKISMRDNTSRNKKRFSVPKRLAEEEEKNKERLEQLTSENQRLLFESDKLKQEVMMLKEQNSEQKKRIEFLEELLVKEQELNKGSLYAINNAQVAISKQMEHLINISERKSIFKRLLPKRDSVNIYENNNADNI